MVFAEASMGRLLVSEEEEEDDHHQAEDGLSTVKSVLMGTAQVDRRNTYNLSVMLNKYGSKCKQCCIYTY